MGSGKPEQKLSKLKNTRSRPSTTKFKKKPHRNLPLHTTSNVKKKNKKKNDDDRDENHNDDAPPLKSSASQQISFFLDEFQSANSLQLSSLELDSIKDTSFVEVPEEEISQGGDVIKSLGKIVKGVFGDSWKEALCEGRLVEGEIEAGSPAVLMIATSASRSIELLRGVRSMTRECYGVKLFSKHMKVEEQVASLKNRVNFASGTPNRLKKLIEIEALGLSRLKFIVLDIHPDVKGYSLLTLPQVRDEFWDLYKNFFHQRLLQGALHICLFGPIPKVGTFRGKRKSSHD